jgi:hypothetical protein
MSLLSDVLHDFGEDFKITSVFVCAGDAIGGVQNDIDNYCGKLLEARSSGRLIPELASIPDEDFESHIRKLGRVAAKQYELLAAKKLDALFLSLTNTSSAELLLTILGVTRSPEGYSPIPRDEGTATKIVRTAMLMDEDYKRVEAVRTVLTRSNIKRQISDLLDEDDPLLRQISIELGDEL